MTFAAFLPSGWVPAALAGRHPDTLSMAHSPRVHSSPLGLSVLLPMGCLALICLPGLLFAAESGYQPTLIQFCTPVEFILFAATLLGVALFHNHTLAVALGGLTVIIAFKLLFTGFAAGPGLGGLVDHLGHEWVLLANLLGLLLGFALLARHFEDSHIPQLLPRFLPEGWLGGFVLLVMIFVLSRFLDNIAAALVGGTIAAGVFRYRVPVSYTHLTLPTSDLV